MHLSVNWESSLEELDIEHEWQLLIATALTPQVCAAAVWINMHLQVGHYTLMAPSRAIQQTVVDCDKGAHLLYFTTEIIVMYWMCVCLDKDDWSVFSCHCCSVSSPGHRYRLMRLTSWKCGLFGLRLYCMYVFYVIYVDFLLGYSTLTR